MSRRNTNIISRFLLSTLAIFIFFFITITPTITNGQDLVIDAARFTSSLEVAYLTTDRSSQCQVAAGCLPQDTTDQRRVVRADIVIANLGAQATELSSNTGNAFLNNTPCDARTKGMINLLHFELTDDLGFITYATFSRTLCLYDGEQSSLYTGSGQPASAFYTCNTTTSRGLYQGLSVGWQVTYSKNLDCFAIDVTDLAVETNYRLTVRVNNPMVFPDLNLTNNEVSANFYLAPDACPPVPRYSNSSTAFNWVDPVDANHTLVSSFDLTEIALSASTQMKFFCYSTQSIWISPFGYVSFTDLQGNDDAPNMPDNFFNATMAPYWYYQWERASDNATSGLYYSLTGNVGSRTLIVTWLLMVAPDSTTTSDYGQSFQLVYTEATQVVEFRYLRVDTPDPAFASGNAQTIGISGPYIDSFSSHFILISDDVYQSVADSTAIRFTPQLPGGSNGSHPIASTTGPYEGFAQRPITFDSAGSTGGTSLTYFWNFGDGQYPARQLDARLNYTYLSSGIYNASLKVSNGMDESDLVYVLVDADQLPGDGGPVTPNDDGGDGETLAIVVGVVIPVVVILAILVCIVAAVLVYCNRGIVPSGGAWWNEDPEFVNLPHTWGTEEAGASAK